MVHVFPNNVESTPSIRALLEKLIHNCLVSLIITQHLQQLHSVWLNLWSSNQNSSGGSTWHNSFFACLVCIYELALYAAQICSTLAAIVPILEDTHRYHFHQCFLLSSEWFGLNLCLEFCFTAVVGRSWKWILTSAFCGPVQDLDHLYHLAVSCVQDCLEHKGLSC